MVFQSKLCTPGSIKGVMKGKHYNRCWLIHEAFAECVEQLYMDSMNNPPSLNINNPSEVLNNLNNGEVKKYLSLCNSVHVNLNLGLTGRYWMTYCWLVDLLHIFHYAINQNNYDLRLAVWEEMLPFYFVFNKVHYARYEPYYINQLQYLQNTHPGAKEEIQEYGLSVRRNSYGIGQAVNLAGEQTFMKSAKTSGN